MSLINKMLQDLDQRHAADGGEETLTRQLRPVRASGQRDLFWRILAGLMLMIVAWSGWVLYQITPRPVATGLALESQAKRPAAPQAPAGDPARTAATTATPQAPTGQPATAAAAPAVEKSEPVPAPVETGEPAKVDMLKLATEIATPFTEKSFGAKHKAEAKADVKADAARGAKAAVQPAPAAAAPRSAKAAQKPAAEPVPVAAATPQSDSSAPAPKARKPVSIDKQLHVSPPAQRAEDEYRRAAGLLNQGRVAEAIEAYKSALQQDAAHPGARQALVGLLLENRRMDEAQHYLQEGLSLNPNQSAYAMLSARILVERGDLQGAHDLLGKHAAGATANADYHAFDAALLQRLGRHKEAVSAYQTALGIVPSAGLWWMGMGISLQADKRNAEALQAFRRAKSAGGLSPELLAFVDQRMKQLQ